MASFATNLTRGEEIMIQCTQQELEERFTFIIKNITEGNENRLNALLCPEPFSWDAEKSTAKIRFKGKEWEKNQRGELHGGAIASMFDTAMGMSVLAFSGAKEVSTADLNISYIRPFLGESYVIDVDVVHLGSKLVRTMAKAYDEQTKKCLASATGNFVFLKI